jgi:hypothetical protein
MPHLWNPVAVNRRLLRGPKRGSFTSTRSFNSWDAHPASPSTGLDETLHLDLPNPPRSRVGQGQGEGGGDQPGQQTTDGAHVNLLSSARRHTWGNSVSAITTPSPSCCTGSTRCCEEDAYHRHGAASKTLAFLFAFCLEAAAGVGPVTSEDVNRARSEHGARPLAGAVVAATEMPSRVIHGPRPLSGQ